MKKLISILLTISMVCSLVVVPAFAGTTLPTEIGGDGKTYYLISSADDYVKFIDLAQSGSYSKMNINAKLTADIDMDNVTDKTRTDFTIGRYDSNTTPTYLYPYTGTFDGNNKVIRNFKTKRNLNNNNQSAIGMFACTKGATIKNLGVEDAYIHNSYTSTVTKRNYYGGVIVGADKGNTIIEGCYVKNSTIYKDQQMDGDQWNYAGFIAGSIAATSVVNNSYSTANTYSFNDSVYKAGGNAVSGFIGMALGKVTNSFSKNIAFTDNSTAYGFCRKQTDIFTSCYTDSDLAAVSTYNCGANVITDEEEWSELDTVLGDGFKKDTFKINGGAPRFSWEPDPEYYTVTINDAITGGSVTADKLIAEEGEEITLNVTAEESNRIVSVTVNGEEIASPYTFTMPAENVTVDAVFKSLFGSGNGSAQSPYVITSIDELEQLRIAVNNENHFEGVYFELGNDLDFEGVEFGTIGQIGSDAQKSARWFAGSFDGKNHVIKNLTINTAQRFVALFGQIKNATIKNLGIENSTFRQQGNFYAAGIVSLANNSEISGCFVKNTTVNVKCASGSNGQYAGGIVSQATGSTVISDCYVKGITLKTETSGVYFNGAAGGIAGGISGTAQINNCYSSDITYTNAGGNTANIARVSGSAVITNSYTSEKRPKDSDLITVLDPDSEKWLTLAELLGRENWKNDSFALNDGKPMLKWEEEPTGAYSVTIADNIVGGKISASCDRAVGGAIVKLSVTPDENSWVESVSVNGEIIEAPYKFTMPEADVTINAVFTVNTPKEYSIKIAESIVGGTLQVSSETALVGDVVTLSVTADEFYSISKVTVNGNEIEAPYTFNMPASDVIVDATFTCVWAKGDGTEASPFVISTIAELGELRKAVNAEKHLEGVYFELGNDLDFSGVEFGTIGQIGSEAQKSARWFAGNFDGKNHVIKNLTINTAQRFVALFGQIKNATIKNLGIENSTFRQQGNFYAAGIVSLANNSEISNCFVKNTTVNVKCASGSNGQYAGGIVSQATGSTAISDCYVKGITLKTETSGVYFNGAAGGIAGGIAGTSQIKNCYASGVKFTNAGGNTANIARVSGSAVITNAFAEGKLGKDSASITVIDAGSDEWLTLASRLGSAFVNDTYNQNGGLPRLSWEAGVQQYKINVADNSEGGKVTSSHVTAFVGDTVTLNIIPDAGYAIDRVFADINPGEDFSVQELSAPYTFIMPSNDVDVMAQFTKVYFGQTEGEYCLIGTPEEYVEFRKLANMYPGANAKLTADLDMSAYAGTDISIGNVDANANDGDTTVAYSGIFDGNGHVIKNLSIARKLNNDSNKGLAMFNRTKGATIKNLGLVNAYILNTSPDRANSYMGGFVAHGTSTRIENCFVKESSILADNNTYLNSAGPIAGYLDSCYVVNCYARDNKIGNTMTSLVTTASGASVSGFIGRVNANATADCIENCYAHSNVFVNIGQTKKAGFVRAGSSGKTDIAFKNSYTDTLVGMDSESTMNKISSLSEEWLTLASKLGSAFKNDNQKYPHNNGLPRLDWEYVPDYEIISVDAEATLTVRFAENKEIENTTIYVATYDDNGKLLGVNCSEVSLLDGVFASDISLSDAVKVKVFIWDENNKPCSAVYSGTIIKGALFNDENLPYTVKDGIMNITTTDVSADYASFDDTLWSDVTGVTKIVIGPQIKSIGENAFTGFNDVTSVEIPESVTEISDNSFADASFTVCGYASSEAERFANAIGKDFVLKKLRILTIGNSHTSDYVTFFSKIIKDLYKSGVETEVVYTALTNGGFTMYRDRGKTDDGYPKSHYVNGTNQSSALYPKYSAQLDGNKWDLVLIQDYRESGENADVVSDFTEGMAKTMKWLRSKQPDAKIGWIVDWVDKNYSVSTVSQLAELYNKNTVRNINAVKAMTENAPDYIIPMATALLNLRTTYMSDVNNASDCYTNDSNSDWSGSDEIVNYNIIERDGTHLSYEMGRYIAGAAVLGYIFDLYQDKLMGAENLDFADALETAPETVGVNEWKGEFTDNIWDITKETVRNTVNNPYSITNSVYITDPADEEAIAVANAKYVDFTPSSIVNTIKSLGEGFTVSESDVKINGNSATVRFLYGYTEKIVTITK